MPAAQPHTRRRVALRRALAIAAVSWVALVGAAGPVDASAGQTPSTSTTEPAATATETEPAETSSTARDLLVSGDGSAGAASTTTTSTTVAEVAAEEGSLDEQAQIWLIVGGLVMVALLIGVWTWRYWVRTRPDPGDEGPDPTTVFHGS